MSDDQNELLSLQEAAARLHVDVRTIRRYIQWGRLRGYRLGPKLLRVDAAAVDQLLKPVPAVVQRPVPQQRATQAAALRTVVTSIMELKPEQLSPARQQRPWDRWDAYLVEVVPQDVNVLAPRSAERLGGGSEGVP